MLTQEQNDALKQKLDITLVKHRKGGWNKETNSHTMLAYISGKTAIDAANRIFGFGQWGYEIISLQRDQIEDEKKGLVTVYNAVISLHVAGAAFPFPGDGMGIVKYPSVESHETAKKDSVTDALKRALRHYGEQFGLSLYDEECEVIAPDGETVKVKNILSAKSKQARRVVDSAKSAKQIAQPAQPTVVEATAQPQESISDKLNRLYNKAKRAGKCNSLPAFLFYVGGLAGENVTAESISEQHIKLIEADLSQVA